MRGLPLILALLIAACRDQEAPPAPTSEQADQLNDAEAMLNEQMEAEKMLNEEAER